jgi:hypothetical protein
MALIALVVSKKKTALQKAGCDHAALAVCVGFNGDICTEHGYNKKKH